MLPSAYAIAFYWTEVHTGRCWQPLTGIWHWSSHVVLLNCFISRRETRKVGDSNDDEASYLRPGSCGTGRNRPGARVGYRHIQTPEILPWDRQEQDWSFPSSGLPALALVALCPRPLPHQRWLNKELVARLSLLSPYKIMPSRTWNSSWCQWGISRNLLLPMMYAHPFKGLHSLCHPNKLNQFSKAIPGYVFLYLRTHRRPRSRLCPPLSVSFPPSSPAGLHNWPDYPRGRSRYETTSASSAFQGGHAYSSPFNRKEWKHRG